MPTNEQRRAAAKRKLERQLERRAQQARRNRILTIVGAVVAVLVVAGAAGTAIVLKSHHNSERSTASATTSSEASEAPGAPGQLPAFKPPADLGANCEYPPSVEPASKPVEPPRSGKVPTDPAQISVSMVTDQGPIGLMLNNAQAPCTVNSFASLASKHFFDNTGCHRLTTAPVLHVLQCGDPTGTGTGGPGYQFANEYPTNQYPPGDPALQEPVTYPRGTLAMAHSAQPNSNGSQFFLVYQDSKLPPDYTVFGKIQDDGLATLDKIAKGGVAPGGKAPDDGPPNTKVTITSALLD
ncbi:peptidylprolyl isomerase [Mycobacterium talmoniae]|uniref:Peptidylprolyl isomerase n=1 Tax=Mycobacterium talmoniae TaxID=1858794 RepID=A0A1S1NMU1_9MYCO|nr:MULTISPECIES: peptidylprolyl isomerase [Mycobacterium]OHV04087.1 peptidylprolyl isomerase [Mycobacterium talmoniae]PQM47341.1 putative peptidyl-prolyl cis-trans isomerase B [Mycobacterium talmoniae]TDH52696.1 peptidylprolyl isomerase [Mycobacterium eburneum]